ncbi:hypothetical protein BU16DRAFT_538315 [Lophium mytilinum]|uniref:Uncharacterized protein n=1 Tax=Lophium mytilinum TaxID=390894 RepID=A0A6A6QZQ6_9PEZI|nr:hypothetical protein BU16DRAFT_538315 [Lophium mytilinum]
MSRKNKTKKSSKPSKPVAAKKLTRAEKKAQRAEERFLDEVIRVANQERQDLENAMLRQRLQQFSANSSANYPTSSIFGTRRTRTQNRDEPQYSDAQIFEMIEARIVELENQVEAAERALAEEERRLLEREEIERRIKVRIAAFLNAEEEARRRVRQGVEGVSRFLSSQDNLDQDREGDSDSDQSSESDGEHPVYKPRLSRPRDPLGEDDDDADDEDYSDVETIDDEESLDEGDLRENVPDDGFFNGASQDEDVPDEDSLDEDTSDNDAPDKDAPDKDIHDEEFPEEGSSEPLAEEGKSRQASLRSKLDMLPNIVPREGSQPSTRDTESKEDLFDRAPSRAGSSEINDTPIDPSDINEDPEEKAAENSSHEVEEECVQEVKDSSGAVEISTEPSGAVENVEEDQADASIWEEKEKYIQDTKDSPTEDAIDNVLVEPSDAAQNSENETTGGDTGEEADSDDVQCSHDSPCGNDASIESSDALDVAESVFGELPSEDEVVEEVAEGINDDPTEDDVAVEFSGALYEPEEETAGQLSAEEEEEVSRDIEDDCSENELSLPSYEAAWDPEEESLHRNTHADDKEASLSVEDNPREATLHGDAEIEVTTSEEQESIRPEDPYPIDHPILEDGLSPAESNRLIYECLKRRP